ncbi:MAG TPA: TIGR01777 family oxidoreductase [Cytophagaceae bacterium]|jgi:uncharacterized protein (TIGR01777 family)|nr:TIGR01777 family oxidoreductase [Cytophagaceae bacterium]
MKTVLVAGASGLVGSDTVALLKQKGFIVYTLSNSLSTDIKKCRFHWSPATCEIDKRCLEGVDHVVNLSGAGLFDHRWTTSYKKEIAESRIKSTTLLVDTIVNNQFPVQMFINASAIGIYGTDTGDAWLSENAPTGSDFLANVVKQWEQSLFDKEELKSRKVCLRFGIVLSDRGGALPRMAAPVKYGVGSPFGSGKQYVSWIHLHDLSRMILFAIEKTETNGFYNAVAPEPVTNEVLIKAIAKRLNRKLWAPNVPEFGLNLIVGKERAASLLGGNRVKDDKISSLGFEFDYKTLHQVLLTFFSSKNNV